MLTRRSPLLDIKIDDLSGEPTRALLALHLAGMNANSPAGHVFALDLSGLETADVIVWTGWIDREIASIGALKLLPDGGGEIKSMRTHPDHLRKGAARVLLQHIIQEARDRNLSHLSLETGSGPSFEPALALYRAEGFQNGEAFADYVPSEFNHFLHLPLR